MIHGKNDFAEVFKNLH